MKYDTEDYSSDYSSFKYGSSYGGSDSFDSEPIEPVEIDYGSALGVVKSDLWRKATPAQRGKTVDLAFTRLIESAEKNPDRKITWTNRQGEAKDIPLFNPDKSWTATGKEWLQQQRSYLTAAAEDESGGVEWDRFDQEFVAPQHLSSILDRQKQFDPFSDLQNWMSEKNAVATEDETASLAWEDFVSYANSDVKSDEAKIDPENKELKKQWSQRMARELYTPETLGEEVMMQKVGGQWVLNSMNYSEIDKMENAINSNEELSLADKKILLGDYRSQVEANAGKIVNAFATADAGVIGSMFSRPLNDEFAEEMSKPGASAYEFIKARKDRFSKDSYGVTSEIAGTLRDAVMATGTGALWLASFGNYTSPAEAFGGLAEDTAKAYSDTTQFSAFGIDVSRRDLTQLTGQVGSFVVTGRMGALSGKLLTRAGAVGASRYAVGEGGKLVLKSSTAKAASLAATKDVLKAGGNLPKVSIPAKMGGWLKDAATDPELYIGSLQAAGMGFGSAFNEAYERTGSRDEALKAANIEGISGGIAVMIATGVMNRVAPGMGKALGMGDEGVGTSLIQNLRNRVVHKEGMEATQKSLEHLAGDAGAGLRKQFAKDIAQEMNDAARQLGLKGVGVLGNIGAEAVEESADAIISDSISAMLDHSKTWNEEVWGNIGTKWKEYVKAGVLGAIGGGMGASIGTATNAPQVFGKSDALNAMSDTWKAIETNIGNLGNDSLKMDVGGKAMSVSEMLSTELDPNQKIDIEKKSAMLVRAARGIGVYQAMPSSLVPTASQTAPTDTSGTSSLDATQAPPEDSQRAYPQGSLGQVMQSVGEEAPAGREWSRDSKAVEGSETSYKNKTGNFTLTPIHAVNDVSGKRNDNVAFKMVPFTSRLGKKTEGKPEYLTPAQAQSKLKEIGKNKEAAKLDRIVNATPEEKAQQYDEWTNETNKQSTTVDANNIQVTPPGEKGPRDSAPPQDDSDIGITSDGGPDPTRQPDPSPPTPAAVVPVSQITSFNNNFKGSFDAAKPAIITELSTLPIGSKMGGVNGGLIEKTGDDEYSTVIAGETVKYKANDVVGFVNGAKVVLPATESSNAPLVEAKAETPTPEPALVETKKEETEEPKPKPTPSSGNKKGIVKVSANLLKRFSKKAFSKNSLHKLATKLTQNGVSIYSVDTYAEAMVIYGDDPDFKDPHAEKHGWAMMAGIDKKGNKVIVINNVSEKHGDQKIEENLFHEYVHTEELLFRSTPEGEALYQAFAKTLDPSSKTYDAKLQKLMEREYVGYAGLTVSGKASEVIRAASEGLLRGKTSETTGVFSKYLKAFLSHIKAKFGSDPEFSEYLNPILKNIQDTISQTQSKNTQPSDPIDSLIAELEREIEEESKDSDLDKKEEPTPVDLPPSEKAEVDVAEEVLTDEEKAKFSEFIGDDSWTKKTAVRFVGMMNDWVASGQKAFGKMASLFKKVWAKIKKNTGKASVIISVSSMMGISPTANIDTSPDNRSVTSTSAPASHPGFVGLPTDYVDVPMDAETKAILQNGAAYVYDVEQSVNITIFETPAGKIDPNINPDPIKKANLKGATLSSHAQRMANWVVANGDNAGKIFVIADKQAGTASFFDKNGVLIRHVPALYGKTIGDFISDKTLAKSTFTVTDKEKITPAGRFETWNKQSILGNGLVAVYKKGDVSNLAFHKVYLKKPSEKRDYLLATPTGEDNRISHGCINLPTKDAQELIPLMDGGSVTYILPETEEGVKSFKGFEEIIANEAGANPLSALLLSLAMLAKARRNNGSTKKDVAAEVERLISESNLSDEQKNAARSRIGLAIEQTTWEESKPQSTKSDEKQTENKTEAEGLQVEEDQAEEEVVESPKTPEQKIAERLERDGIASTPELIASEYAKTEAGNPNNRISNTIKAIQKLSEEGHVPMRAASVADAPDITDGLDPDSTYIVEAATLDGGTDAAGAKWTRKSSENGKERYGYMPPKGMASTMGVGDTVVIAGNDKQVLMLKKVVDGELIFEALNIDFDAANQNALNEQLRKTSARYTRSILDRSIKSIVPMMSRFSDGSITLAEVETIFKDLLSIVAPRNNFKVVERKIDGDGYIFAEPAEKGSKKSSSIVVDYEKLKAELVKLYSNSDKGNQFAQELLAYDAAALITTVLSEEGIHIVTYGTFTRSELLSYYDNLWDLNDAFRSEQEAKGVAEGKIKDHPLFEELKKVAAERGVTKSLDPNSEKGATEKQRQEIAGELMRKFVQMALSGTTTERQSQLSKMLQRAMILDESNAREKKGFVKYLKAIGHMVRRYAERMRTILWINTQRGMLPSNLQEPLNRLIEATKKSGLTVDVLNAHSDTIAERTKMEELYNKSLESELQIIARNNSFPMRQLRNFLAASNRINIDIAIVHDPETMEIGLHPTLRELLENQKGENKIDMKALDDQFDRLNGKGGYSEDQTPAMKKIRTGVFLKWQKLQLLRDALPAQFSDMDLWTGAMKPDREGITRIDREKLFSDLFLDLEGKVSRSYASEVNKLIQEFKVSGYAENRKEIKIAHEKLDTYLIGRIKGLDLAKTKDMRRLFEWSQMIKLDPEDIVTSGINADVDSTPEELALALEKNRNRLLQILPMWSQLIHEARDKAPFGKHLRGKLKTLFDDYASLSNELDQNIQWQRQTYNDNLKKINELSDSTETSKDSDFVKVGEFTRAVDDYNHALKTAKNRAIGEFGLRTVGFGTAIKVQAINPESENPNSYSSLPPVDTGVDDLLDVVQDVGYSNIFPYEHQNGYDNSNADAPYSYSSRFIYPQRQESAVGQTESDGLAIGLDPNSKWERPGDEGLTPAEREWNAGLERYRHTTESNFMASGRNAFADFFVAENIGEIRNVDMIEAYAQTAGFSFDKTTNPDDDSVRYDSLLEAMPIFDHQKLNRLVGGLRRLKRGLRSDNNQDPTKVIADLFSYLEEMRQWSTKIRSLYQGSGFMPRIGRMQTLAGRSLPIFDQAFSNETDNGTLTNGLDLQIRRMHEALMLKAMEYVEVKNISMDKAYLKSADTLVLNNGLPVLKAGVDKKKLTDLAENLLKVVGEGNQKVMFDRSLYEAVQSVNLVRKQTKAFMDRKWRSNVEKEGSRTVTDPAYIPEYEQLTKLRNGALSPRTLKNLSFAMKYFEKERDYQFSANFGFEMLADFDKLSFGEGYESYVYTEAKAYDVYLSDSEAALVTTKEDGTLTHPNVPEYSELKQDKDGRYFYRKQFQSPNYNEIVVSPQQAGFDDPRSRPFLTGEESPLLEGMNEVKSGGVSSQRETAQRRATSLQTARERNVALWSMLIGSNTTTGRSATAGRIFYFDLLQADEDGFVTVDEVLEDRRRMKTAPRYKRKQTLSRRVDGSPFETTDDTYIEEEFETMEEFSEDELSAMDETQLKNYFKVMRDKSLLERGLVGIFPNINPARKEFFDEIRNGFLEKYGVQNSDIRTKVKSFSYNFISSEKFLHDLASFKADFERDMIDLAIVKDKGVAAMALETILEYSDVAPHSDIDVSKNWDARIGRDTQDADDALLQFKDKIKKKKPILTKGNNTFASPEEARNIWRLAHSEVMKPENSRQVVDVSKVAFLNSTVGPIIEQFLLTLDGNTIAVMPDETTAAKHQLSDTGIRIFEGGNGNPNVIYVPQASSMRDKRMVDEASMVIAHALSINARKNPSIVDMVNDLAGKVNAALDPIVRAESIESQISPVGKWVTRKQKALDAIESNFQRILEGSPVEFTEKQQARIRELVKAQFIKSIELARELEVGELTADQIALFGGDATFAANVLLVGTIFSNSKAKQFFDQAYFAIESFKPSSLPAMVGDSLINAVMDIARSGEVENGGVDPDWIGESSKVEQSDANQEAIQTFEESEQDRADRIADANAKYQADVDGIEIDEEDQTRTDAIYSVTSGFSDKVKSEIVGMVRANGGEAYFNGKSVFYSDADIVLINSLNSMIASAMKAREGVQPLKPSRDAREMLKEPGYLRDESEIKASELAQPVVAPIGWKDRAGKIYVGEARNLGRPSLPGNRTSLTQGFADKRISNMNANVLQLSPYIQKWIKLRAEESIRQSLEKTRIDAANNKSSLDYSQLKRFKTIDLEIEMSDEIIEELRSILPTGYMDQAEQEVRDEIARLEESVSKMTAAQAKKYQEYAGALFQGVSFPRKDVTKEVSDMMGYSQRFAQRLADILQENVLFEEGKVDQVAKGMSSFVRRQFKNDPLFKAAFNQMATLLDTINRELSVRHVFQEQNEDTVLIESGANPFRTLISSEENETRIGDLIRSYNSNVDVVNLVLDSMAKQGMALIGVDGSTKGYRLPYILGNPESISPQDLISLRRRSFGVDSTAKFKGQLMQHAERTIAAAFSDSIAKELAGAEGKTKMKSIPVGKDTRRNAQVKNFIKIVRQRMEEGRDLDNFDLASEITTALDMMTERLKSDPNGKNFSEYIKSIYLSFAEEDALYDRSLVTDDPSYVNKGQTAEQRDLVNKLEIQLDVISRGLAANQAALDLIDHSDYKQSIGKTYHRGIVGVPAVGQGDKQVLAGIEPMTREAGVNITLVAKGLGLTESGMAARQLWTGDQPSMDEASSAALKAQRRAFYAQKEAVVRALSEFAEERLEAVYRSERNTEENFVEFDPLGTIQKSVELAKVEMTLLDDYFSQAKTEAEKANYRGMMDNAVAILTDPKNPKRYNLLKRSQKNTVNLIRLPQNFEERLERIGMYHSEGGMSMILMPTTAADEMTRTFPGVTKKNVNSEIAHVAMAAQSLSSNQAQGTKTPSYFFEEVNKDTDAEFKSIGKLNQSTKKREGWRLAKQGMTRAQVADAFANEFENRIAKWLEDTRNRFSNGRKKTISMDGRITKAAMSQAKSLIRQIVLAYSSGKLEGNRYITVNSEVEKFMSMIDDIDTDTMGENGMPRSFTFKIEDAGKLITESMQLFKIEKTFSLVFSALEADLIAKRMVSGMTVSDSNTDLTMMRLAHHHDARIRSRFRKSLSAKQAVRHLVGILDHGFDGVSGREGYETSRRIAKEEIGEAARKVGSSAKNHAIGYLLAQIRGIKDAHGMSLSHAYTTWATQQNFGHRQSQDFVTAQEKKYGKNKVSKYWNGGHLDLVRDQPLAAEIDLIMRKATSVISIKSNDPLAEQKAEKAITDLEAALINAIEDNKKSEVDAYAKTLSSVFSDIDAAMHLSLALSSKKGRDVDALDEKTKWKHADIQAFKPTATNVPMRLGYAKDPAARKQGREGRYVSDPIEIVAMDEAAFFGGIAKGEPFERNRVYRPVMVNGLSTPLSIVDDAIYRLNVTPSYEVLRHSIGKVRAPHGPIEITDSDMEDTLRSFNENSDQFETIREANVRNNERYRWMKDANTAFAAVAYELETIVQNDSAIGTAQTGGAETLRFLSAMYIMRALASPLQWWDQSVSPSFGYTVGKLVASKPKSVGLYFSTLSKMLTSSKFRNQIKDFIQETSPYVYYRASDGQDVAEDMIRGQERYGVGQVKAKIGRGFRAYERFAEKALSFTIGTPERMLAGTIYMVELAEKMKAETVQDVLLRKNEITKELAQQAKLKVNDVMAQSDQSKKSWFFQTRDQSPVLNAFWRSLVRFSNHTASMSSNTAVLTQTMFTDQEKGMSEMDDYYVSQKDAEESRREAMENIATTLTQNILFYPMKLKMLLPAVLYLIFKGGDDDDDEAALRAQRVTNEMIAPDENSNVIHRTIMALIFGKDRPLFQDRGTVDEAQASAFAEMLNYTAQEAITTIPLIGVAFGYSPVRGLIDKAFTNPGSEEAAALLMDVERDSVNIRQYRPGFIEGTAEFTAPTGTAYDYAAAAKLLLDYNMTNQASDNRAVSLRDSLLYLMSESLPGTREARSFMQDKLREPVNDEKH